MAYGLWPHSQPCTCPRVLSVAWECAYFKFTCLRFTRGKWLTWRRCFLSAKGIHRGRCWVWPVFSVLGLGASWQPFRETRWRLFMLMSQTDSIYSHHRTSLHELRNGCVQWVPWWMLAIDFVIWTPSGWSRQCRTLMKRHVRAWNTLRPSSFPRAS